MIHSSIYKMRDANDKFSSSSSGVSKGGARDAPPGVQIVPIWEIWQNCM